MTRLRSHLLLSQHSLLSALRTILERGLSRSAVHGFLRHVGQGQLTIPEKNRLSRPFMACKPCFLHLDWKYLQQMADN